MPISCIGTYNSIALAHQYANFFRPLWLVNRRFFSAFFPQGFENDIKTFNYVAYLELHPLFTWHYSFIFQHFLPPWHHILIAVFQEWAINKWISEGAPSNKIVMGITATATTFTLANLSNTDVGAPVGAKGKTGPYLQREGQATYFRVNGWFTVSVYLY